MGPIISAFLGIITVPLTTRYFTRDVFGKAEIFHYVYECVLILVTLGVTNGILRFFYEEQAESRRRFIFRAQLLPVLLALALIPPILIFYRPISIAIIGEPSFSIAVMLAVVMVFGLLERITTLLMRLHEHALAYSVITVLNRLIYIAVLVAFIGLGNVTYSGLIIPSILGVIFYWVAGWFYERRFWLSRRGEEQCRTSYKEFLAYSVPFTGAQFADFVYFRLDKLIMWGLILLGGKGLISDPDLLFTRGDMGLYAAAAKILIFLELLRYAFSLCWGPEIFKSHAEGKDSNLITGRVFSIFVILTSLGVVGIIAGLDIIMLLFGKDFGDVRYVAPVLLLLPAMMLLGVISETGINLAKKPLSHLLIAVVCCIFQLVVSVLAAKWWGLRGIAIGTALTGMLMMYGKGFVSKSLFGSSCRFFRSMPVFGAVFVYALWNTFAPPPIYWNILGALVVAAVPVALFFDTVKELCAEALTLLRTLWVRVRQ